MIDKNITTTKNRLDDILLSKFFAKRLLKYCNEVNINVSKSRLKFLKSFVKRVKRRDENVDALIKRRDNLLISSMLNYKTKSLKFLTTNRVKWFLRLMILTLIASNFFINFIQLFKTLRLFYLSYSNLYLSHRIRYCVIDRLSYFLMRFLIIFSIS